MINLLPDETKKSIRAARNNTVLLRYLLFTGLAVVFLALACMASYYIIKTNAGETNGNTNSNNSSDSSVVNQAKNLVSSLTKAKSILDRQISYSTIITGLATALPIGVVIESPLVLTNSSVGAPITLKAYAKNSSDETALKENLQKSSLFSNYTLQSVANSSTGPASYPFLISFTITINKDAAR